MEQRRLRLRLLGLIVAAGLLTFFLVRRSPSPSSPSDSADSDRARADDTRRAPTGPNAPPSPALPPPGPVAGPAAVPIIDAIEYEKPEVCEGEESLVTIRAHTPDHKDDAYLHYFVGGQNVRSATIIGSRSDDTNEHRTVSVYGRDNTVVSVPLPPLKVKDCKAKHRLLIAQRPVPNTIGVIQLVASVLSRDGTPFSPVKWQWTFGDGQTATTDTPTVDHDYGARPQDSLWSYPVVACTARDAMGRELTGKLGLALHNPSFENRAVKGIVTLLFDFTPRFPQIGSDGVVSQKVRIWHQAEGSVVIDRATKQRRFDEGGEPPAETISVESLLGAREIPSSGIEVALSLDTNDGAHLRAVDYDLEGHAPTGERVAGRFSIMRPPPVPTRENNIPVVDPMLKAKIMRARELLGQQFVTDDDLWRLEQEGRFRDLKIDPATPVGSIAEPARAR